MPIIVRYSSAIAIHWSSGDPGKGPVTRYVIEARPSGTPARSRLFPGSRHPRLTFSLLPESLHLAPFRLLSPEMALVLCQAKLEAACVRGRQGGAPWLGNSPEAPRDWCLVPGELQLRGGVTQEDKDAKS